MGSETCESAVELEMLASGMAKQHENFLDATQELIDNSVAAVVDGESYFDDANKRVNISISFVRGEETVTTYISDNGPGITREALQNHVFRTGNKEISEGILNNVGWGLKASLAWFEESLKQRGLGDDPHWFSLITQTAEGECLRVDGPITGDLPIVDATERDWEVGVPSSVDSLLESDHGTRIQATCARSQFDADVWPSADSLGTKVQYVRERLGILFRRLLSAREDNQIVVHYHDLPSNEQGTFEVPPINPSYTEDTELKSHEFRVSTPRGDQYQVRYKAGTLDIDSMTEWAEEEHPDLLTQSGKFRYRYRPSQNRQGVDIYANGRVLMTSVFEDLFDLTRNNQYNYFGGTLQIFPIGDTDEVPTDNKKTRLDTNSELWREIRKELSDEELLPEGREYGKRVSTGGASTATQAQEKKEPSEEIESTSTFDPDSNVFGLHQGDARSIIPAIKDHTAGELDKKDGLVDTTITSPPYYDLKEYGSSEEDEIGQHGTYVEYLQELQELFSEVYSLTRDDGSLWIVVNTFRRNREIVQLPFDIARVCQNLDQGLECSDCENTILRGIDELDSRQTTCPHCGHTANNDQSWILQDIVVWNKNRALPYTKEGRLRNVFEYILCFSKSPDYELQMDQIRESDPAQFKKWWADFPERYHPLGKLPENIWEFEPPTRGSFTGEVDVFDHPAAFPPKLIERILTLSTESGDVVLDPFAGSGVVLGQAELMDRNPIGIELNEKYSKAYPDLKRYLEEHHEEEDQVATQEDLDRIICGLRQTKYARELLRTMANKLGLSSPSQLDVHTAFLVSRELGYQSVEDDIHGRIDLVLLVDDETTARQALDYDEIAEEVTTIQPCSGFGIRARTLVMRAEEFISEVDDETYTHLPEELFIYEGGRHYVYSEEISYSDWQKLNEDTDQWTERHANSDIPPIISNIGIEVNHPKHSMETVSRELSGNHEIQLNKGGGDYYQHIIQTD
ncbi:DNA methyltransferase [Halorubrum ezzemoulense]|uniref:DNA methyltransferase n=1 Tax=Halorubrum ezzemoulense TaxID=337243 RepID=UPI00232E64F5|nr:DNA methyltransferase [Halorubrum ezzemoulense]MDB2225950.1 DNA methyltransferase [Halorubrum ezzemoulense]